MKRETWESPVVSGVLAWILSFNAVGCLATGFGMNVDMAAVGLVCLLWAAACGFCFRVKRGGILLLCLVGLAAGYLWRSGELEDQLPGLLYTITRRYDNGYNSGILGSPGTVVDVPMMCLGAVIVLSVTHAMCRRASAAWAVVVTLIPLALCLVVIDTVPEEGHLYWLLLGLTLLVMTNHLRRTDPAQGNTLTYYLALPLALALGLLFLLVPQRGYDKQPEAVQAMILDWVEDMPDSLEELGEDLASAADGSVQPEEVDLSQVGPMRQYTYPVLDVVVPRSGVLYLREQDYDFYDGTGWSSTVRRNEDFGVTEDLDWQETGTITISTRRSRDLLLLPYYPEDAVTLYSGNAENEDNASAYEFRQYDLPNNWHSIATQHDPEEGTLVLTDGALYDGSNRRYLTLPNASREELEFFLMQILTDEVSATEKAETIAAYVRDSALYDLDTQRMPSGEEDFALWFLNDSDTGYCVHFATTTAVLLRAAGVETRYVTGYMVSVRVGEVTTVTAAEAHAWVEYFEPRLGVWIVLESTPADLSEEENTETTLTDATEEPSASETTQSTRPAETTGPAETEADGEGVANIGGADAPGEGENGTQQWLGTAALILLGVGLVLAVPLQWRFRLALRRGRRETGSPNRRALALWQESERFAKVLGWEMPERLESLAQKARFSQHIMTDEELQVFSDYLEAAEQSCREKHLLKQLIWRLGYALY